MKRYYTRACNFTFSKKGLNLTSKKYFLHGNKNITFDTIELVSRNYSRKIKVKSLKHLNKKLRNSIYKDLKKITKKKKIKKLNFSNTPILMGVINLTPDSFSDGGKFNNSGKAFDQAKKFLKSGCDILDLGGESTRPGSYTVDQVLEWKRIEGPLKKIKKLNKFISIDSRKSYVMRNAYKIKLDLVNDISGLDFDDNTINFLKKSKVPFVIHHIQGTPQNMQKKPKYANVVLDIYDFFEKKIQQIRAAGIKHDNIILDPGIGFGKNLKHNITILKNISIFHSLGFPLLLGTSRKRFIKDLSGVNDSVNRYGGTISSSLYLLMQGVQILRVHDVNEVKQGIKVFKSLIF